MAGEGSEILVERGADGVALVRLNRPEALNALNLALRRQLAEAFSSFHDDESVRAIVITGNDKAFAAGADLKEFAEIDAVAHLKRRYERYWRAVTDTLQPVIAAVNGFALGGGLELAMCADIIIAGRGARLGQPEVKVGLIPGSGGTQRLTRAVGKYKSMLMCLTGDFITGEEAYQMGLASRVVDDADVLDEAMAIARRIAALPPLAVQQAKDVIQAGADASLQSALTIERRAMQVVFSSKDKAEGIDAFINKRKPQFKGE